MKVTGLVNEYLHDTAKLAIGTLECRQPGGSKALQHTFMPPIRKQEVFEEDDRFSSYHHFLQGRPVKVQALEVGNAIPRILQRQTRTFWTVKI